MISAIALVTALPVVTGNVTHFEYVRNVGYDLALDNWRSD
jgi:predicted nucleic acid-binding protein